MEQEEIMSEKPKTKSPWLILFVILVAMMAGAICMNKVAPVLSYINEDLNITSATQSGLLISIFTFTGIFLSIPMGILTTKYGTFRTGVFSMAAVAVGSVLGAVAPNYGILLLSRLIEGLGLMFMGAIGPAAVASAFAGRNSASAMGLLMCYMSFGQIVALNLAPVIAAAGSWRNFWWVSAGFAVFALILWLVVMKDFPDPLKAQPSETEGGGSRVHLGDIARNGSVWLICLGFLTYMIVHFGVFNYLPTYMSEVCGISSTTAGSLTSIASLIGIPIGIIGGVIADRWNSIRKPLILTMILFGVVVAITPVFTSGSFVVYVVLYGIVAMAEAGLSFTAVTQVVLPNQAAVASAALNTAQWIGAFASTIIFGALLDAFGWNTAYWSMVPIVLVGVIATAVNRKLK